MDALYTTPNATRTEVLEGRSYAFRVAVNPEGIPDRFKVRPQWVNWRLELRDGEYTKVPYTPRSFEKASTTDLMTWDSFDGALAALKVGNFDGIGFVFCSADPFVGIDFDKCRDPETGEVDPRVLEYTKKFKKPYVEVSVSGTGVHLITRGKLRGGKRKGNVELYGQERFFAMTGVLL